MQGTTDKISLLLRSLFGVLVGLCIACSAAAADYDVFTPIPPSSQTTDFVQVLRVAGVLQSDQGLDALNAAQRQAIVAIENAQSAPSMGTAVALLSHFPTFADKSNDLFRRTLAKAAMPAFLMADAAKYELILETNKRIHRAEKSISADRGIEVSLRVGSTGKRFAQWQQWKAAGSPMEGEWVYIDPFDPADNAAFNGMPIDDSYRDAKLLSADDDVTNWASEEQRTTDPLANETLNGKRAADEFAAVTREILAELPPELRATVRGGKGWVAPNEMMVEFLSPTQAVNIMANEARRKAKGWEAPIALEKHVDFLGAWILKDMEKYNGLYAEEQLHAWGIKKGYVTEDVERPLADGSSKTYKASAESGKLNAITGSDVFPQGIKDPFGWMATNYRQIFVTHSGDLDSLAKYSERMIDWWKSVNLSDAELRALVRDTPGIAQVTAADFDRLEALARGIRNAKSAEGKRDIIKLAGGKDRALGDLKNLNQAMMLTGQRKHLQQLSDGLLRIIQADVASRTLGKRLEKPLTFQEIIAEANTRNAGKAGKDDPYVSFQTSINAYANGYANLPPKLARNMAVDIAQFVDRDLLLPGGEGQISAELRLHLIPVLQDGAERARDVGTDLREDADGLRRFSDIAESDLGAAIGRKLVDLNEPDLHGYLKKLKLGQISRRQLRLLPTKAGGWPQVQIVDQIWRPADVGNDLKRIMWLGEKLGWTDASFAHRLAAYFNGPEYRTPTLPGEKPSAKRAYADDAVDAFLAFTRMFDRANSTTQFVRMTGSDGEVITKQIRGSRFSDAELNMALVTFEHTVRGSEQVARIWGLKGDVEGLTKFGKTLHALTLGNSDQNQADRARAFATLASDAYGTFPSLAEKFGTQEWADWIETNMGGKSTVLGKAGGTVGALLANADSAFQTPEAQEALYGAFITDLLVVWQPQIATAMAVHAFYKAGSGYFVDQAAKSDLIDFLAANGRWRFETGGQRPVLEGVFAGPLFIADDAAARKKQCVARSKSSFGGEGQTPTVAGIEQILRLDVGIPKNGVALCGKITDGKCTPAETQRLVHPRTAAMTLFASSGLTSTDPLIIPIKDSINGMVGWSYFDPLRRFVSFDDGTQWTAERLATHGIYPPTPEDAPFVLRKPIEVTLKPGDADNRPRDADTQWIHAGIWTSLGAGGRKMLGYMASEYWVRRQYLMECVMLDPWLEAAALKAQKEDFKGIEIGDVAGRLAGLDRRVRALDKKVWKEIAPSYQPYPISHSGAAFPEEQRLAIYDHYLRNSANPRRDLRDLIAWFSGPQSLDNVPFGPLSRAREALSIATAGDLGDFDSDNLRQAQLEDAARLKETQDLLQHHVEKTLANLTDLVAKYETGFDNALKAIAKTRKYVARGDAYKLGPVHVSLMDATAFAPPEGGYGPVEDHLFPPGSWVGKKLWDADENTLLTSLNFADFSAASDGTVGAALRAWDDGYQQVGAAAREGLGEKLARFQITLAAEKGAATAVRYTDKTQQFEAMIGLPLDVLSAAHPLYPRLLRQSFQAHKISLVAKDAARVDPSEVHLVLKDLKKDGSEEKLQAASVDNLKFLGEAFTRDAMGLIALADDLFKIKFDGVQSGETPFVSSTLKREAIPVARTDAELPKVTDKDLKDWVHEVFWEIARKPEFDDPIQRFGLDPDREITFPGPVLVAAGADAAVPPLMTCNASTRDPEYESLVSVLPSASGDAFDLSLPLASPGVYYLRATALSKQGAPLASRTMSFEVAPLELRGGLVVKGGTIDTSKGQKVVVNVGGSAWWEGQSAFNPIDNDIAVLPGDVHPVVTLHQQGLFRAQLCGSLSQTMVSRDVIPPVLIPPAEAAKNITSTGYLFRTAAAFTADAITSKPVSSEVIEPGVFALSAPIEFVLDQAGDVPVTVELIDAAGKIVATAASAIVVEGAETPGPGPVSLGLTEGDEIYARAELAAKGGTLLAQSDPVMFSVALNSEGLTLKPELPGYDRGNLNVSGRFVLPAALQDLGGIGGGALWSNLLPDQGDVVLGASYGFVNDTPVALENGVSIEASLFATDPLETYLTARYTHASGASWLLPKGGVHVLPDIEVTQLIAAPAKVNVTLKDWTGHPLSFQFVDSITLDGTALALNGNHYVAEISFRGRSDKKSLQVIYQTAGGAVTERIEISAEIIGDPMNPRTPDPIEVRLPVYGPGSLRLSGKSDFADAKFSEDPPPANFKVGLVSAPGIDDWTETAGRPFVFDLTFPMRIDDNIEVVGQTRIGRHSLKGLTTTKVPARSGIRPVTLDVGTVVFEQFLDLIAMPNLVGMDITRAKNQYDGSLTIHSYVRDVAPTADHVGKIYRQAPLPHSEDKPSLVPRGMTISLAVYSDQPVFRLRDFTGTDITRAQTLLSDADVRNVSVVIGRAAKDGEQSGLVLRQTPPGGTVINPETEPVILYYSTLVTSQVQPEPKEEDPSSTENPPEPEDPEPAEEEMPEPVAITPLLDPKDGGVTVLGGWSGTLHATHLLIKFDDPTLPLDITCRALDPCLSTWTDMIINTIRQVAAQEAKAAQESDLSLGNVAGAAAEGIADGIGAAIMAAVAIGGVAAVDKLFTGVSYGLMIAQDETGNITIKLPDAKGEGGLGVFLESAVTTVHDTGDLTFAVENFDLEGEGRLDLQLDIMKTDTGVSLELAFEAAGIAEPIRIEVTLAGDLVAGTPDMTPILPQLMTELQGFVENPDPKFERYLNRIVAEMEKLDQ